MENRLKGHKMLEVVVGIIIGVISIIVTVIIIRQTAKKYRH